jgi:hypothetical protein
MGSCSMGGSSRPSPRFSGPRIRPPLWSSLTSDLNTKRRDTWPLQRLAVSPAASPAGKLRQKGLYLFFRFGGLSSSFAAFGGKALASRRCTFEGRGPFLAEGITVSQRGKGIGGVMQERGDSGLA